MAEKKTDGNEKEKKKSLSHRIAEAEASGEGRAAQKMKASGLLRNEESLGKKGREYDKKTGKKLPREGYGVVSFVKPWKRHYPGDTAGFKMPLAEALVRAGAAVWEKEFKQTLLSRFKK